LLCHVAVALSYSPAPAAIPASSFTRNNYNFSDLYGTRGTHLNQNSRARSISNKPPLSRFSNTIDFNIPGPASSSYETRGEEIRIPKKSTQREEFLHLQHNLAREVRDRSRIVAVQATASNPSYHCGDTSPSYQLVLN